MKQLLFILSFFACASVSAQSLEEFKKREKHFGDSLVATGRYNHFISMSVDDPMCPGKIIYSIAFRLDSNITANPDSLRVYCDTTFFKQFARKVLEVDLLKFCDISFMFFDHRGRVVFEYRKRQVYKTVKW
jgi:hypothetical protein